MDNQYFDIDSLNELKRISRGKQGGKFWTGVLTGFGVTFVVMVAAFCVYLAVTNSLSQDKTDQSQQNVISSILEGSLDDHGINSDTLKKLQKMEDYIQDSFYLHEVTTEDLENGIFRGMMDSLNDPYSVYYTPEEVVALFQETGGYYYGIGAYVSLDEDYHMPKISGIIANSPAEEAKLWPEDIIYEINEESTYNWELSDAVAKIKGEENTTVTLTILRNGEKMTFTVTRRKVETPTVSQKMLDNDLAYIQITEFSETSVNQFADALSFAKENKAKGIVLDLRGNPGGSLSAVLNIARQILPKGLIVYTENKNGERENYSCDGSKELKLPLAVLVDGNSASASEILTGAIQDYGIGTIVGTTTFGKGIVQQINQLPDSSAIKITISSYFTPNGRNIHGVGIEPDVVCEFDAAAYYDEENPTDNQLEKAKEILMEKIK